MQSTQTQTGQGNSTASLLSGFSPVPTRIGQRPPLVVANDNAATSMKQQVVDMLQEFGLKIAVAHRSAAEAYLSQDLYAEALPHLEAAVRFAPDDLEHLNQLGFVRYIAGDDQGAIGCFDSVITRSPNNADALFNLGMVTFGRGDFVRAEEAFRRALTIRGADAEAWNNRGVCLHRLGRTSEAIECFRRALQVNPNDEDATINLQALGGSK